MRSKTNRILTAGAALVLAACGGGSSTQPANTTFAEGALIYNPPIRVGSVTAADFTASLTAQAATNPSAAQLLALLKTASLLPVCGVDFHYIQYYTVGGAGEQTTASGALMVPTGLPGVCTGARPIVVYAHGTAIQRNYNIANPNDTSNPASTESTLIATMFAAQGYIVVAPNYAGYDSSSLPYHPWLNGNQQSKDMIDALAAARSALGRVPAASTVDGGKLFITGYSQGGHVAMATLRALQAAGAPVTAAAPMSGPYALEAFGDAIIYGDVNIGSTLFFPLLTTSYQRSYGNLYSSLTDVYSSTYANGIDMLLPGPNTEQQLFTQGLLPPSALFDSTTPVVPGQPALTAALAVPTSPPAPPFAPAGFGNPYLVTNNFRLAYAIDAATNPDGAVPVPQAGVPVAANPMHPLRQDFKKNDLRNPLWAPMAPTLMCGGGEDPTVFFQNAQIMNAFWQPLNLPAGLVTTLDVDLATATPQDSPPPFVPVQAAFTGTWNALVAAEGPQTAITQYHTTVAPFCMLAASGFFKNF